MEEKKDYAATLNLLKTSFKMKASLPNKEPLLLRDWQKKKIYEKTLGRFGKKFILHDGPPYANGDLHVGHAENKILKEQYENMSDEELIERYTDSEDYLLEAKIVILEELKKRGLKSKEEINQKLEKVEKEKIEKDKMNEERHRKKKEKVDKVIKSKITMTLGIMSIISVISLIITLFAVSIYRTGKFEIEQKKEAQLKEKNNKLRFTQGQTAEGSPLSQSCSGIPRRKAE